MILRRLFETNEIYELLDYYDQYFEVKVSSRVNLREYAEKLNIFAKVYAVMVDANTCIGYTAFYSNDLTNQLGYLAQVVIENKYQGQGYASQILKKMEYIMQEDGMKRIELEVLCNNKRAISFYKKNGYKIDRYIVNDLGGQSIIMTKEID